MNARRIKLSELSTLFKVVTAAGVHPHIGHQSLAHTEGAIRTILNQEVKINEDALTSALWSAKMLDEMHLLEPLIGMKFKELLAITMPNVSEYYFWEQKNK